MVQALARSFFERPTLRVARELLGSVVVRRVGHTVMHALISEVEAYHGSEDPASHAFRGPTKRNQIMFGPPGYAYVYFVYGNHWCVNVVTESDGVAAAILIRGAVPLRGITHMARYRFGNTKLTSQRERILSNGPGKLTQALAITGALNGVDLCSARSPLYIAPGQRVAPKQIERTPRIGISAAQERLWRFVVKDTAQLV